ncbi:DUF6427 family protein [Riemerella anatipestifer]|uniref:DUF6427 family protein n=1 Tax=Riemerella anatipestifer TaxID=34085 RepID=UPI001374A539|nr:DUF6427 family protein [Riemerella anatipestifer]
MFRLLSNEIKIFSIPIYIGVLFLMVIGFNALNINTVEVFSGLFSFTGIALGYFLFNKIGLNYNRHVPFFIYTFIVFAFYEGNLDIGIAFNLFTNAFVLLILTTGEEVFKKNYYLIVGALLALGYLFLPTVWAFTIFVIIHLIATSDKIGLNIFRLVFGFMLVLLSYFGVMYLLGSNSFNPAYLPLISPRFQENYYPLYFLLPVLLMVFYAVANHFIHFNKKSPISRFKYTFILLYTLTQSITIFLYMGTVYEYLLFIALPVSIIVSRALRFMPKYWMQELGLWVVVLSLVLFKIGTFLDIKEIINL